MKNSVFSLFLTCSMFHFYYFYINNATNPIIFYLTSSCPFVFTFKCLCINLFFLSFTFDDSIQLIGLHLMIIVIVN